MFLKELAIKLVERLSINNYNIDLKEGKQLLYGLIYRLRLGKLKTPKTQVETNLANSFIRLSKFLIKASI